MNAHSASGPPVSIIGIGCRLPGASGVDEFWRLLRTGQDAITDPPPGRLGAGPGGYLRDIEWFDSDWFAISARAAATMDPQQRLALAVSVEALDDSGIGYRTRGSGAAVVFGAGGYEHGSALLGGGGHDAPYAITGSALSIIANRVSYVLDLHGPSFVVDSACSSALAAIDLAVRLLDDPAVPFAIVGGVNLALLPHTANYLAESGFLAPDGRVKPFDADADGYARAEGCAVVVLRRTADALRDGDRIYAEIAGTAVGSDGRTEVLTAPNGSAQRQVIRTAWDRAGLDPGAAGYIECHGIGTQLGDTVEVAALAAALGPHTAPVWIGSVKSNLGHLEAAAGITGLIKAALSIRHGTIVPTINLHSENPALRLAEHGLRVPTEPVDWSGTPLPERFAGVSSFGLGGTNAHAVLRGIAAPPYTRGDEPPYLIPVTGRDIAALRAQADHLADYFSVDRNASQPESDIGTHDDVASGTRVRKRPDEPVSARHDSAHRAVRNRNANTAAPVSDRDSGELVDARRTAADPVESIGARQQMPTDEARAASRSTALPSLLSNPAAAVGDQGFDNPNRTVTHSGEASASAGVADDRATGTGWAEGESLRNTGQLRAAVAAVARLIPETARAAVIARDRADAVERLRVLAQGGSDAGVVGPTTVTRTGGVVFLFSGQGGQHAKMGRALAARYPVFARALTEAVDAVAAAGGPRIWTPRNGFTLERAALGETGSAATELVQPAIFAFQVAMAALLAAWGVRPGAVIGHSLGEVAAAVVGGALTLPDAARVVMWRSRILSQLDGRGAMALLDAPPDEVATLVEPMRTEIGIAAVNGPRSVVVSGTPRYIDTLVRRAERRNIFAQRIAVAFAAHSPQVAPLVPELLGALAGLAPRTPHTTIYSTARDGSSVTTMDAAYWAESATGTVELAAALECVAADGFSTVVEISPHPVLTGAVREYPELRDAAYAACGREDEAAAYLTCLARLHADGRPVEWAAQGPFTGAPPLRNWTERKFPLLTGSAQEPTETRTPTEDLADHMVLGMPTVPAAYWLHRLLELTRTQGWQEAPGWVSSTAVTDFVIHERIDLAELPAVTYRRNGDGSMRAEATGGGALASSRPAGGPTPADIVAWMRSVDGNRARHHRMRPISPGLFYDTLRMRGLAYGPRFRPLRAIAAERDGASGTASALGIFEAAPLHRTATLDGCLQLLAAAASDELPAEAVPLPIAIESGWVSGESDRVLLDAHAFVRERTPDGVIGDVIGTDQHGAPAVALTGVHLRFARTDRAVDPYLTPALVSEVPLYQEVWVPLRGSGTGPAAVPERAVVIGESHAAIRLARELERRVPTERVARDPDAASAAVASVLSGRGISSGIAVVIVWPQRSDDARDDDANRRTVTALTRVLELLQYLQSTDAPASLTVVLPVEALAQRTRAMPVPGALAGLVRALQLESDRPIQLVWTDGHHDSLRSIADSVSAARHFDELRLAEGTAHIRRFTRARPQSIGPVAIDPHGTYVVTGGLGALGALTVRWLLDAGARDVVVLTRTPRPLPEPLEDLEDRLVVVRCDAADRDDLCNALNDIRECGSTVRGVVHAVGAPVSAPFEAITADQLTRVCTPILTAARNLIELTARDPIDFALLHSSAAGAIGAPGQAAYASASAALDALTLAYPNRPVRSIGWGAWESPHPTGDAPQPHRAATRPFDPQRGTELLTQLLRYPGPYLLALDYQPTTDTTPLTRRLSKLLDGEPDSDLADDTDGAPAHSEPALLSIESGGANAAG
ncbi:type I polyketide synthase [Nocardia arthritidis]|uniref:SDR family NAD(P)-dependent oxidoreductase n=1 Tax=Nocardia arthritidis TaxID=228602 RepID=A0A6G9YTX4_9NOCA|nr:type I polyketide synthase [Nocardia arthritidis]QIS16785.1 SDR family NAD(P)-dependent oxidoreductase [Nocardia arthritidis]